MLPKLTAILHIVFLLGGVCTRLHSHKVWEEEARQTICGKDYQSVGGVRYAVADYNILTFSY